MSEELTKQYRNGTLEGGDYYVRVGQAITEILYYSSALKRFTDGEKDEIIEVLCKVPTYEEYMDSKWWLAKLSDHSAKLGDKVNESIRKSED